MSASPFLYPNVTSVPSKTDISPSERLPKKQDGVPSEFDKALEQTLQNDRSIDQKGVGRDLNQVKAPLKFSAHASQRLRDRKISLDPATLTKVNDALDKAEAKGIDDTLVLTQDAALIVSVKNRTVVTALDRGSMIGNVFTNIDGAVII